jgi:RimJ/RimL family protein N-acetyltransferase
LETSHEYEVFIAGESVDLCIPDEFAIDQDGWTSWLNNTPKLQNTQHGVFPATQEAQYDYLESIRSKESFTLLICRKSDRAPVGTISLKAIDLSFRRAEIAIMVGAPEKLSLPGVAALEAMALITAHGFEEMGLMRIHAGQAFPSLKGWNQLLEIIGYRPEGISRNAFRRGHKYSDVITISCLYDDYLRLKKHRGEYWPGGKNVRVLIKNQPKVSFGEKLQKFIDENADDHFSYLFE